LRNELIKDQLDSKNLKKIKSLENDEKEALELMETSKQNYEELARVNQQIEQEKNKDKLKLLLKDAVKFEKKAIQNRIESLKCMHEVLVQRYKIYKSDLKKYYETAGTNQLDSAEKLEKLAHDVFESADLNIERFYYTLSQVDLFNFLTKANQSEQLGLLYQEKMYALLLNWSEPEKIKLNKEIFAYQDNTSVIENIFEENTIKTKDSISYRTIVIYDTIKVKKNINDTIFKVQIAALKSEIEIKNLQKHYPNFPKIEIENDGVWHKYTVGAFKNFAEANKFLNKTGVPDAFIVAYKNGKRLSPILNYPESENISEL